MNSPGLGLRAALALSLALHAGAFALGLWLGAAPQRRPAPPIEARLLPPELPEPPPPAQPALMLPEPPVEPPRPAARAPEHRPETAKPGTLSGVTRQEANRQLAERLLYPPEAIAQGIEGEVLVMLFLDESGSALAARVEKSSGHALLDDAAVQAARTLRTLPGGGAREALLPVRFRLR